MSSSALGHRTPQPHHLHLGPVPQALGSSGVCLWSHSTPFLVGTPDFPNFSGSLLGVKKTGKKHRLQRGISHQPFLLIKTLPNTVFSPCESCPSWVRWVSWSCVTFLVFSFPGVLSLNAVVTSASLMGSLTPSGQGSTICDLMWL